jgi:hypothetical protein
MTNPRLFKHTSVQRRADAVTWRGVAIDEASRRALAIREVGGKTGIHTRINRMINERSFIAFTSRGVLFNGLKERGTRSRLQRLTCCADFVEKQT